ncbi:enoyl-CoA hydratase-related protein, partial [Mycobacterium avium]|uniref:enoyl-CoA hydratase-related protein n=1 Tax=Mycobacterium avium TaxID=1764 RepID=UPI000B067610
MPSSAIATLAPVAGLDVTLSDGVFSVTINRPDSLNSLTVPVITGIADAMEYAATDPEVKVVRIGGGGRGFSSRGGINPRDGSHRGGGP